MGRIIIGTLVGTVLLFMLQGLMWEGGIHKDMWQYSTKQDSMFEQIKSYGLPEGLYVFPAVDPAMGHTKEKEMYMKGVGKPWAMLFYHPSMHGEDMHILVMGILHALIACLLACMVIYYGRFSSFGSRFLTGLSFGLFTIVQGVMPNLNWWGFPWSFIRPQVVDLTLIWGICCIWFAIYVKRKEPKGA